MTLAFLVFALVMLLLAKDRLADSAAGCYTRMAGPETEESLSLPESESPEPNVRVVPPAAPEAHPDSHSQ